MKTSRAFELVDTEAALVNCCKQLQQSSWLAIDTEFEREKTYYPELCLLQIASESQVVLIDPLAVTDLSPVFQLVYDENITKVFHAARQDLEIFYHLRAELPGRLFDTQLAAPLLGYDEQISYARLVQQILGVTLDKAHTRTTWKKRPLNQAQLQYAADDVIYLAALYPVMRAKLEEKGRLTWLAGGFAELSDMALYDIDLEAMIRKLRGAARLNATKSAVLHQLFSWREDVARAENKPRNWILRSETLLDLARVMPASIAEMERIKGIGGGALKRYANQILHLCSSSGTHQTGPRGTVKQKKGLSEEQKVLHDALSIIVRIIAVKNELNPQVLASPRQLEKFIQRDESCQLLQGWRKTMLGEELQAFMDGHRSIKVESACVEIQKI